MASKQGKPFSPEIKEIIIQVKNYFDRNRKGFGSLDSSVQMTADALGIGLGTVQRIHASYKKGISFIEELPKERGRPSYSIQEESASLVRDFIRKANMQGEFVSVDILKNYLEALKPEEDFSSATLARALDRWGFVFRKGVRTQHLKEKDQVVLKRQAYLRLKRANRKNLGVKRPEVYLDESYVNKNHSSDWTWYSQEDGPWVQKPTGVGERLVLMNAITESGWVPGAQCVFKASRKTGDYHGQMNGEMFQKWFANQLLPNIPPHSLIILDNASYHNVLSPSSAPLATSKKEKIFFWLTSNGTPCSPDLLKAELVELLQKTNVQPTYLLDEMAQAKGHDVVRTPPYHPELQPIEICWGVVKNHVGKNNNLTMPGLMKALNAGFDKVNSSTCQKIIHNVREIEDLLWEQDRLFDKWDEESSGDEEASSLS